MAAPAIPQSDRPSAYVVLFPFLGKNAAEYWNLKSLGEKLALAEEGIEDVSSLPA